MRRVTVFALVAGFTFAALGSASGGAAESATERLAEKLDAWRTKARPELKAAAEAGPDALVEKFQELAAPFVKENSKLIDEVYAERLARLPKGSPPAPKLYERREFELPPDIGSATRKHAAVFRLTNPGPAEAAKKWTEMTLGWNDRDGLAKRLAVWAVVPPKPAGLPGPAKGLDRILLDDGDEKFVVTLKYEDGLALPASIERWALKK